MLGILTQALLPKFCIEPIFDGFGFSNCCVPIGLTFLSYYAICSRRLRTNFLAFVVPFCSCCCCSYVLFLYLCICLLFRGVSAALPRPLCGVGSTAIATNLVINLCLSH